MHYESVNDTAARLGVTVRAVQKWAAAGKIPDVQRVGKQWLIPTEFTGPFVDNKKRTPMPLLNAAFTVGHCEKYIGEIAEHSTRDIALAEYYYFTGDAVKSAQITEKYINSQDMTLSLCANALYTFANISCGRLHLAHYGIKGLDTIAKKAFGSKAKAEEKALAVFFSNLISVLMHIDNKTIPPLYTELVKLPKGLRIFGAYLLAHQAYLKKDYRRALGITDMALTLPEEEYPLPKIYIHLIATVSLVNTKHIDDARQHFLSAIELARLDGLFQPFAEHHGLLQGMIETLRFKDTDIYEKIITITERFSDNWRSIHNEKAAKTVTVSLKPNEFSVAMLYSRGWRVAEIAGHLELSERTVKRIISDIYEKLDITSRGELNKYMLT